MQVADKLEVTDTAQKMKFSMKDFFSKCDQIAVSFNGKLHFLCSYHRDVFRNLSNNYDGTFGKNS